MSDRLLLLSYAFPPIAAADAFLSAKTMGNLPGCTVDVISTAVAENNLPADYSLDEYVKRRFGRVVRVLAPQIARRIPKHCSVICQLPDFFVYLNRQLLRHALALDLSRYKAVITWSQWHSVHLAGLKLKEENPGLRWIAHFSDPWSDNPFSDYNIFTKWANKRMERRVVSKADVVLFTSPETIDIMMRKYPSSYRAKTFYVPHCYDSTLYDDTLMPSEKAYVIRHIGSLYGRRSPKPLYEALEHIARKSPRLLAGVTFEFIGYLERHKSLIDNYPLAGQKVRFTGSVPYIESLQLMQTAHCLLAIDAPTECSIFFPSKLVDYIGAKRFIMAISPRGTVANIVNELGGAVADPSDVSAIAATLRKVLEQRPSKLPSQAHRYEKDAVCKEMIRIIEQPIRAL